MSYYTEKIIDISQEMAYFARRLEQLHDARDLWVNPKRSGSFSVGHVNRKVVQPSGTITPALAGVQREALKLYDAEILSVESQIEGLRYKLATIAKADVAITKAEGMTDHEIVVLTPTDVEKNNDIQ